MIRKNICNWLRKSCCTYGKGSRKIIKDFITDGIVKVKYGHTVAALELDGIEGVIAGSCGTNGNDGPTDAAGQLPMGRPLQEQKRLI